ncbi:hypothetical protein ACQJBY_013484 [Aegilops geniculata]
MPFTDFRLERSLQTAMSTQIRPPWRCWRTPDQQLPTTPTRMLALGVVNISVVRATAEQELGCDDGRASRRGLRSHLTWLTRRHLGGRKGNRRAHDDPQTTLCLGDYASVASQQCDAICFVAIKKCFATRYVQIQIRCSLQ